MTDEQKPIWLEDVANVLLEFNGTLEKVMKARGELIIWLFKRANHLHGILGWIIDTFLDGSVIVDHEEIGKYVWLFEQDENTKELKVVKKEIPHD